MALVSRLFSRGITPHCLLFHDAAVGTGASDTDAPMLGQVCRLRASRRPIAPMQRPSVARLGRHAPRLSLTPTPFSCEGRCEGCLPPSARLTLGASAELAQESSRRASMVAGGAHDGSARRASSVVRRSSAIGAAAGGVDGFVDILLEKGGFDFEGEGMVASQPEH